MTELAPLDRVSAELARDSWGPWSVSVSRIGHNRYAIMGRSRQLAFSAIAVWDDDSPYTAITHWVGWLCTDRNERARQRFRALGAA